MADLKTLAVIVGTRPDVIKMAPLVIELRKHDRFKVVLISTGQHRELLDSALASFGLTPDFDLGVMLQNQTLADITVGILGKLGPILEEIKPDMVLVHGDTPTAFVASLSSYYQKIAIGHVEAGLRTYNKYQPFPEEMNRQIVDVLSDVFFVPTQETYDNLIAENKPKEQIAITGNTVIDALFMAAEQNREFKNEELQKIDFNKKVILLTSHRRESLGETMSGIFKAIRKVVDEHEDVEVVFPVHLNPKVKDTAVLHFTEPQRIHLLDPLDYSDIVRVMKQCYFVITDSGGLQEEAPAFHKPVLVIREVTERPEGEKAGTLRVIGTKEEKVYAEISELLNNIDTYQKMSQAVNPYGDGHASEKIAAFLEEYFS